MTINGAFDSQSGSRAVDRALRLLRAVINSPEGVSLTEASKQAELATSTAARLLATLERNEFISRDDVGRYHVGASLLRAGAFALSGLGLLRMAEPRLKDLSDITQETAYLSVPDGENAATYLMQVESPHAIRHASWTGRKIRTDGSATGAALAGDVNSLGFASSTACAFEPDAATVAAPVRDRNGVIVGAVSVIGPTFRVGPVELDLYGRAVADAAAHVSEGLGYVALESGSPI